MSKISKCLMVFLFLFPAAVWAEEAALSTIVKGAVWLEDTKGSQTPLQNFIKLHNGDILHLGDNAHLQIAYFKSASQETWIGPGNIVIGAGRSKAATAQLQPQTKQLPLQMARQLAKTPTTDSRGKAAVIRTRSIGPSSSVEQVKHNYLEMCSQSEQNDRNPDLYLLSAYFEIKEYELVRETLSQLEIRHPGDMEIKLLKSLYAKAIKNAKMAVQ